MNTQKVIELLGFSPKEAKVYLAALSLGEAHISDIATKVKLPVSSTQIIADKLHDNGLMNFYVMRRYKYWVAENPEHLLVTLRNREKLVQEAMPELMELREAAWNKRKTKVARVSEWEPFRALADGSPQAILITDEKAAIVYVNAHWEKQFGYSLDEVRNQNPRMLQSGKTPREVYQRMWEVLHKDQIFQSDEIVDKKRDGTYFTLLTTILPARHKNKLFYIQILDDITERKRVESLTQQFSCL